MKLYRVDDVLSDYADIGGYYIFAENLSDLGKILKDIRFYHYYNDEKGRETLQKKICYKMLKIVPYMIID